MEDFLYDKLLLLNDIYNNTLVPNIEKSINNSQIKTKLFQHQLTLVNGMHSYRDKMTHGFLLENKTINGKIGIIGDPAGTGKTLSILTYLSQVTTFPKITCELGNNSSRYFFSHELYKLSDKSTNLVIVPRSLFNQWQQEISKHTTLKYIAIETKRMLKDDITESIVNSSFILTINTCYKYVQEYANKYNIQWNNIFIDESSYIYFNLFRIEVE